jgi:uncharacterized protein
MSFETSRAILIFSKSAQSGNVKTRLQPFLNEEQSLKLHIALLQDTIQKALLARADPLLYLAGGMELPFAPGIQVREQNGKDLGERMLNAFREALKLYSKVIIIGTDSPTFPLTAFDQAYQRLENHDVVLGPSEDGGYYLIALSKIIPEIFYDVPWGTAEVLNVTLRLLGKKKVSLLEQCFDIDQPADLERLREELKQNNAAYLSHVREWLRAL